MSNYLEDNLTSGTFGTDIDGQSAQIGGTWTKLTSGGIAYFGATGAIYTGFRGFYTNTVTPPSADFTAGLTIRPASSPTDVISVVGRVSNSNQDYYGVRWNGAANQMELFKSFHNILTVLQFIPYDMDSDLTGVSTLITVTVIGTALSWTVGGVAQTGSTDSAISAVGLTGMTGVQGAGSSLMHFHDVYAADAAVASRRRAFII